MSYEWQHQLSSFNKLSRLIIIYIMNRREPNSKFIIIGDFNIPCIEWFDEIGRCIALNYEGRIWSKLLNTLTCTNLSQLNHIKKIITTYSCPREWRKHHNVVFQCYVYIVSFGYNVHTVFELRFRCPANLVW